jgi:hypothetical protein
MSDTYCKRRAGEQLASPGKRAKVSIDSEGQLQQCQTELNAMNDCSRVRTLKALWPMLGQLRYSIVVKFHYNPKNF